MWRPLERSTAAGTPGNTVLTCKNHRIGRSAILVSFGILRALILAHSGSGSRHGQCEHLKHSFRSRIVSVATARTPDCTGHAREHRVYMQKSQNRQIGDFGNYWNFPGPDPGPSGSGRRRGQCEHLKHGSRSRIVSVATGRTPGGTRHTREHRVYMQKSQNRRIGDFGNFLNFPGSDPGPFGLRESSWAVRAPETRFP
jgi:hypothetical protein